MQLAVIIKIGGGYHVNRFFVIVVVFVLLLLKDFKVIKKEFKKNPFKIVYELFFLLSLVTFLIAIMMDEVIIMNTAAIVLFIFSIKFMAEQWKTDKKQVFFLC